MRYLVKFSSSGGSCSSELELESPEKFYETINLKKWLPITGTPYLLVNLSLVESISFEEAP